jgi:energy-coupling factor transporter transmembrane protein EcfT
MPRRGVEQLVQRSFLRRVDPRTKLALSATATAALMLPLPQLAVFGAAYLVVALGAGVGRPLFTAVRRIAFLVAVLAVVGWAWIGPAFALLISLRLLLLAVAFTVFVATTTPDELHAALECMGLPARVAFVGAASFRLLPQLEAQWRGIIEAQHARGIAPVRVTWRDWRRGLANAVPLVVPAVVLATQRAWSITEAAAVRGLESPLRRPARRVRLQWIDGLLLVGALGFLAGLVTYR